MSIKTQRLWRRNRELIEIRITPDAKFAVICEYGKWFDVAEVYIKNLLKDEPIETIPRRKEAWKSHELAYVTDISPNGRLVAITYHQAPADGHDGMGAYIWDRKQEKFLEPFIEHHKMHYKSYVAGGIDGQRGYDYLDIRFLPDNERVITVTISGEVLVWSLSQQKLLWAVSAAAHIADSVAFSHKFGLFAMSDYMGKTHRISMIGQYTTSFNKIWDEQFGIWVSAENLKKGPSFRLWNTYSGSLIHEFDVNEQVNQLVFSPNDKFIAGEMNDTCFIWEVETGELVDALPKNTKPIAFSSNNQFLITQLGESQIGLWDLQAKQWHYLYDLEGKLRSAQISASDKIIAITDSNNANNEWLLHEIQLS